VRPDSITHYDRANTIRKSLMIPVMQAESHAFPDHLTRMVSLPMLGFLRRLSSIFPLLPPPSPSQIRRLCHRSRIGRVVPSEEIVDSDASADYPTLSKLPVQGQISPSPTTVSPISTVLISLGDMTVHKPAWTLEATLRLSSSCRMSPQYIAAGACRTGSSSDSGLCSISGS